MLYSISNKYGTHCDIKKINNIRGGYSKNISDSSSDDSDSGSLLGSNNSCKTYRLPVGCKEMNSLYHVVTDNLNNYKYQSNEAIKSYPKFDNSSFNLSRGTSYPLPVITVSLRGGNKHRATTVAGLTCMWDKRATNNIIKIRHPKHYVHKMRYNKVEYSTAAGVYFATHDVKVHFFMLEFSSSKIINHRFHVGKGKGELRIGYDMIICRDLMVQKSFTANFNR